MAAYQEAHAGTRAKYQHNKYQGPKTSGAPLSTLTSTTASDLELVQGLLGITDYITIPYFVGALDVHDGRSTDSVHAPTEDEAKDAETRLRKLTANGWLHMSAERNADGSFLEYRWELS